MQRVVPFLAAVVVMIGAAAVAQEQRTQSAPPAPKPAPTPLGAAGNWTGTWGTYQPGAAKPGPALRLDCKVVEQNGKWQATFEGECGRPYKYTITMEGRPAGDVVLFKGTTDLGEKDGGVYDWIGRASGDEFLGFYTSRAYTGTFRLARAK